MAWAPVAAEAAEPEAERLAAAALAATQAGLAAVMPTRGCAWSSCRLSHIFRGKLRCAGSSGSRSIDGWARLLQCKRA